MSWARGAVLLVALGLVRACNSFEGPSDSETHFLRGCDDDCGDLECICGVCTQACQSSCAALSEAAFCRGAASGQRPACLDGQTAPAPFCDVSCGIDADCAGVSSELACVQGRCRPRVTSVAPRRDASTGADIALPDASTFQSGSPPDAGWSDQLPDGAPRPVELR